MSVNKEQELKKRVLRHINRIYSDNLSDNEIIELSQNLAEHVISSQVNLPIHITEDGESWSESTVILITYADSVEEKNSLPIKSIHNNAYKELENYSWPGNIKELETFINRLVILSPGKLINEKFVKSELDKVKEQLNNDFSNFSEIFDLELENFFKNVDISRYSDCLYNFLLRKLEYSLIRKTLLVVNGNQIKASRLLGLNRNTLRKKINELDIEIIKKVKS